MADVTRRNMLRVAPVAAEGQLHELACPRYPSLDLWRGVACLLVVVNHSASRQAVPPTDDTVAWVGYCLGEIAHRLWIGVPIFFVISGYCIAATADSSRRKSVGYLSFTARRIRRIFPPYLICLGISVALVAVAEMLRSGSIAATNVGCMHRPWWYSGSKWVGNISLTELWRYHFFGSPKGLFLGHAWTLCYEEQFYGVTAVILLVCPRRLFTALLVLTVACPFVVLVCGWNGVPIDGFFFDGAWTLFACGLLVYWSLNYGSLTKRAVAGVVLAITLAYAARDPSRLLDTEKNSDQSLFVAAAFALLGLLGRRADGWLTSRVWLRPLFACGTMCYSLYLVHFPVTVFLNAFARQCGVNVTMVSPLLTVPIGIAASVAVAWLFYHTVERRFLNITGPKTGGVTVAPAPDSISLTPPLYLGVGTQKRDEVTGRIFDAPKPAAQGTSNFPGGPNGC